MADMASRSRVLLHNPIKQIFVLLAWRRVSSCHSSSSPSPPSSPWQPELQVLHDVVASSSTGGLDGMEASLDRLDFPISPSLFSQVVGSCKSSASAAVAANGSVGGGRRILRFFTWFRRRRHEGIAIGDNRDPTFDDEAAFNITIGALAKMKDVVALRIAISELRKERQAMCPDAFVSSLDALVWSGRAEEAAGLFRMTLKKANRESHLLLRRREGWSSIFATVHALCAKGHARLAQDLLWRHQNVVADESVDLQAVRKCILHAWCVHGDVKEARQVIGQMKKAGHPPSLVSYNAFIRCLCQHNLRFNPSALVAEAAAVMTEMRSAGVPPTAASSNILLSCLSRARRVKEACKVLQGMERDEDCGPDWVSYYLVIRALYLTRRFGRGNMLVGRMLDEGMMPGARFYHGLISILCGMEKVEYAIQLLRRMNQFCCECNGPTYDLLIAKLCRSGLYDAAKALWEEATGRGIPLMCSSDLLDPSKNEVFIPVRPMKKVIPVKKIRFMPGRKKNFSRFKRKVRSKRPCRA